MLDHMLLCLEAKHRSEMRPKSGWQKIASNQHDDRISSLPDVIIGEILSLIPTREAVATSILSKRWRYLWTLLKNLDFHYCYACRKKNDHNAFVKYVDGVFSKCTTRELNKLKLYGYCGGETHRWIEEAITRNVQILELDLPLLELPGSVFTCKSLTWLKSYVNLDRVLNIPDSCYLPKLKGLSIFFSSQSIGFAQKLVSGCPSMEYFFMSGEIGSKQRFVISLPLLNRLEMYTTPYDSGGNEYTLVIDAPKLQSLEGLGNADPKMLPIFNKLTLLELEMDSFYGWEIVSDLLQACPTLEVFNVDMNDELEDKDREFHWIEPQHVPECLSSCLRVIKIEWNFKEDYKHVLEMMKYLLGNGEVLQKFTFNGWQLSEELAFCKKLLTFPRASRYCEVEVR